MKTLAISLIIATMAATLYVACVELVNIESSVLFIKFFGFVSQLLIDIYAIVAILRNKDNNRLNKPRGCLTTKVRQPLACYVKKDLVDQSSLWITRPERSLGSNHVVLGGMMLPVSAMSMSCFIDTG